MNPKPIPRVCLSESEQRAMALYLESMGQNGLAQCLGVSRNVILRAASGQQLSQRTVAMIRARIAPSQAF